MGIRRELVAEGSGGGRGGSGGGGLSTRRRLENRPRSIVASSLRPVRSSAQSMASISELQVCTGTPWDSRNEPRSAAFSGMLPSAGTLPRARRATGAEAGAASGVCGLGCHGSLDRPTHVRLPLALPSLSSAPQSSSAQMMGMITLQLCFVATTFLPWTLMGRTLCNTLYRHPWILYTGPRPFLSGF